MEYGGGTIGYILQPGDPCYDPEVAHGLIMGTALDSNYAWSPGEEDFEGETSDLIGTGSSNTGNIIGEYGGEDDDEPGYAALAAREYGGGDYTDWYLPSYDEIYGILSTLMDLYSGDENQIVSDLLEGRQFWSSTSSRSYDTWAVYIGYDTGYSGFSEGATARISPKSVLPVRSF